MSESKFIFDYFRYPVIPVKFYYKDKETPIIDEGGKVKIITINLNIETVEGFSGHSDRNQIVSYLKRISPKPEQIIVTHGEKSKCLSISNFFRRTFGLKANAPTVLETIRLK